ncbi:MAG: hypothetical protein GW855_00900 [Erythrobacter sp.]|nr:hypothetical protein [Erythrobacter sp.]
MAGKIPSSAEGRREYARKQRRKRTLAKAAVIVLCLVTLALLAYAFLWRA